MTETRPPRYLLQVAVELTLYKGDWQSEAMTANVSHSGMFVVDPSPPDRGTTVKFVMNFEEGRCHGYGVVVWTRDEPDAEGPAGMGIEFRSFSGNDRFLLSRALHEFQFGPEGASGSDSGRRME